MKITKSALKELIKEELDNPNIKEGEVFADKDAATELELFITNDGDLYRQQYYPIIKNLVAKRARGVYDPLKAVKLFMYLVDNGAKKYAKEFDAPGARWHEVDGTPMAVHRARWHEVFDKATRLMVARNLADEFDAEVETGAYDDLIPKKYRVKEELGEEDIDTERLGLLEGLTVVKVEDKRTHGRDWFTLHMSDGGKFRVYDGNWYTTGTSAELQETEELGEAALETEAVLIKGKGMDANGNHRVVVERPGRKAFSIQTNVNLPQSHRILRGYKSIKEVPEEELQVVKQEVVGYLNKQ